MSKKVSENFGNNVIIFKDNQELIKTIIDLKSNRSKSVLFSKKSIKFSKKLNWKKVGLKYIRLLNF